MLGSRDVRDPVRGPLATLLAQPRRAAVLIVLLLADESEFVARDSLLALLWREYDEERARTALRQSLSFLRRALGEASIQSRGDDAIAINPTVVTCDLWAFRAALRDRRDDDALALYRGELLTGFVVDDAPAFEQWIADRRRTLAKEAATAASRSADHHRDHGDAGRALERACMAKRIEPFNESRVPSC